MQSSTNSFLDYLNSMNNADANGKGALAESQVSSPFYQKIMVRRGISDFLLKQVTEKPTAIILTGHAGDGKTSLLAQLLEDLGCLTDRKLKENDTVISPNVELFYVKDMSELTKNKQEELLKCTLEAPQNGCSAVLVSNTGPIINTTERLMKNSSADEFKRVEMDLLERMDTNDTKEISIDGNSCIVINIARLDNVHIASKVLTNLVQQELWTECNGCEICTQCPIHHNQQLVSRMLDRVNYFVNGYYRFLQEHDNRLTIRQILAHLSFAITGNLTCKQISKLGPAAKYDYHFANLFFGYIGSKQFNPAKQIKAISSLQELGFESISLKVDYKLFVQHNYDDFDNETKSVLVNANERFNQKANVPTETCLLHRRSIRRFYLLFSLLDIGARDQLFQEIISPIYPLYLKAISNMLDPLEKRHLQSLIFNALYMLYVGTPSQSHNEIPLTLRRSDTITQPVQLLQGKVPLHDISIGQSKKTAEIDSDVTLFSVNLLINRIECPFNLSFPLINYFWHISNGAVATALAPALSHGIDRLKALLLEKYAHHSIDGQKQMYLLLQTNKGTKSIRCEIVDNDLYVE